MSVRDACNNHDAGFAGITTYDPINRIFVDYRPMSRLMVDKKYRSDIQAMCRRRLDLDGNLATCFGGLGLEDFKNAVRVNPVWRLAAGRSDHMLRHRAKQLGSSSSTPIRRFQATRSRRVVTPTPPAPAATTPERGQVLSKFQRVSADPG